MCDSSSLLYEYVFMLLSMGQAHTGQLVAVPERLLRRGHSSGQLHSVV